MIITVTRRLWGTPIGTVQKFIILKDGIPFREYDEEQLRFFLFALKVKGWD